MPLRRIIKNVVKNYSDAQVKVREATSNDPWGPSSTLMTEIADLTYNVLAFTEIMQMLWKRLNDHGRNWRHVYKALVLLEYIIKTGSEKVAQQCREKIYAIQTLKDFQYVEETRDYGQNIREKARQLTTLLKDSERLKNERAKALKAKEKFAQNSAGVPMGPNFASTSPALPNILSYPEHSTGRYSGFGSPSSWSLEGNGSSALPLDVELEAVRPTSSGEEQLQLELAMAISKVEHEQQLKALKGDEVKLQMALKQSKIETTKPLSSTLPAATADPWDTRGGCLDGDDSHFETTSPWLETAHSSAAWPGVGGQVNGENTAVAEASFKTVFQPFLDDEFEEFSSMRGKKQRQPFDDFPAPGLDTAFKDLSFNEASIATPVSLIDQNCTSNQQPPSYSSSSSSKTPRGKSPKDFLGENAALVNLDNLMCPEKPAPLFPLAHSPSSASPLRDNSSTSCLNPFFPTPSQGVTSSMGRQHEKGPSFLCNVSNFLVSASSSPIHQPVSQPLSTTTTHHTLPMVSTTTTQPTPLPATYPTEFNPFL